VQRRPRQVRDLRHVQRDEHASPHVAGVVAMIEALGVTRPSAVVDVLSVSARCPAGGLSGELYVRASWTRAPRWRTSFGVTSGFASSRSPDSRGSCAAGSCGAAAGSRVFAAPFSAPGLRASPFAVCAHRGLLAQAGKLRDYVEVAMRPLGEWDSVLLGAGFHRWLLLASALPAIALSAFGFASHRLRPFIGGVALGSAALLLQMAWSADVAFVGGAFCANLGARKCVGLFLDCQGSPRRKAAMKPASVL